MIRYANEEEKAIKSNVRRSLPADKPVELEAPPRDVSLIQRGSQSDVYYSIDGHFLYDRPRVYLRDG
jgi:hypothetical protein